MSKRIPKHALKDLPAPHVLHSTQRPEDPQTKLHTTCRLNCSGIQPHKLNITFTHHPHDAGSVGAPQSVHATLHIKRVGASRVMNEANMGITHHKNNCNQYGLTAYMGKQ